MKAIETMDLEHGASVHGQETVIHFEEGLIGFADHKRFMLLENDYLAPFRLLQAEGAPDVGFLVIEPTIRSPEYCTLVPRREWEALGVEDPADGLAFVTVILGTSAATSTANFQAPILINCRKMIGRQVILTDSGFSVRHPLV
jgi:flagellar assembly factor FliW